MGLFSGSKEFNPRQRPQINWEAERAASDRARAEIARVDQAARDSAMDAHRAVDPLNQLVERCHALEQLLAAQDQRLAALEAKDR